MGILSRLLELPWPASALSFSLEPFQSSDNPARSLGSTQFALDGWVTSTFVAQTLVPLVDVHPFPLQELMLMTAKLCRFKPSLIFESSPSIGKLAKIFHEIAQHFHIPTTIHSCDLPDHVDHVEIPPAQRGAMVRGLEGAELHLGDDLATSLRLWERAGRLPSPLFYLDCDHNFASVRREIDGILTTVPEPVLLLHGTFLQSSESGSNSGPRHAVEESQAAHPGPFRAMHSGPSLPGMTLLYSAATAAA